MKGKTLALGALLAAGMVFWAGCAAVVIGAGAGVGGTAYVRGEPKSSEPVTLDTAWKATQAAVKDLQYVVQAKEKDALAAKMEAKNAADKTVTIKLTSKGEKVTEIGVRVGFWGDETASRQIFDKIKSHF